MEDQSTDSGDLTADADSASVPQGKAGRTRHRLPRQKAQPTGQSESGDEVAAEVRTDEVVEEIPEPESAEAAVTEPADDVAASVAPTKRRRLPWRRNPAPEVAPVPTAQVEPDPEPVVATAAEESESSGETARPPVELADTELADTELAETELAETEEADETDGDSVEPEPEPVLVPHRPAGRVLKYAAVAAGVLFVAAAAFAGATVQPYLTDRAAVQTKFAVAETASNAITTLWTYTPEDMDKLPERSAIYLGGDFAADYRRYIDAIAAPNKQAQVSNNTQVLGAAVESLTPTEATAIVYTNSVATSPVTKGIPSLRYLSYRLTMKRDANRWLITQMVAVTKLDLTPRL